MVTVFGDNSVRGFDRDTLERETSTMLPLPYRLRYDAASDRLLVATADLLQNCLTDLDPVTGEVRARSVRPESLIFDEED